MVLTAAAICTALTDTPCPKAMRVLVHLRSSRRRSGSTPGVSPVHADVGALAEAELARGSRRAGRWSNWCAASTVPMLEDWAITPARVSWSVPCGEPVVDHPVAARAAAPGTMSRCAAVTLPASISDDRVSTFSTEPGS